MKAVKFVKSTGNLPITKYVSDEINAEGQYVSLAEYQELRRLLERVDAIDYETFNDEAKYQLMEVLSDIKEVLK